MSQEDHDPIMISIEFKRCTFQILKDCQGQRTGNGSDNSIQFINFGRVGDKSFKEWRQKIGGRKGG